MEESKVKYFIDIIDSINNRYVSNSLKLGVLGDGEHWEIKHKRLSSCFTAKRRFY